MNQALIRFWIVTLMIVTGASVAGADWVQLANGDMLRGDVVLLDKKELKLSSESFGELTIPRDKVEAIYMGDARPPVAAVAPGQTPLRFSGDMPSLQNPQVRQMYDSLLNRVLGGDTNLEDIQQNYRQARDQLKDLQEGMHPAERQALQGYIDIFNLLAPPSQESSGPGSANPAPGQGSAPAAQPSAPTPSNQDSSKSRDRECSPIFLRGRLPALDGNVNRQHDHGAEKRQDPT